MNTEAQGPDAGVASAGAAAALAGGDDGKTITVGSQFMDVGALTILSNNSNNNQILDLHSSGSGLALNASSGTGTAIYGETQDSTGVSAGVYGYNPTNGVAVAGFSPTGTGLHGMSRDGVAVHASATTANAVALLAEGRFQVPQVSGVDTIVSGQSSVLISPHLPIGAESFVLLTPAGNLKGRSLWYVAQPGTDGTFTIFISNPADANVQIAWLLVG